MKTIKRIATLTLIAFSLAGCFSDSSVDEVKGLVYNNIDSTNTLGNALDTRNMCEKVKWESGKDERKRDVVTYNCNLTGYDVYFSKWNDYYIKEFTSNQEKELAKLKKDYDEELEEVTINNAVDKIHKDLFDGGIYQTLAKIKNKVQVIQIITRFANGENDELERRIGRLHLNEKDRDEFLQAAKDFSHVISEYQDSLPMSREYLFEDVIDKLNNGVSQEKILKDIKMSQIPVKELLVGTEIKINKIEKSITSESLQELRKGWENNQPTDIIQTVTYATSKGNRPVLLSCKFEFYTPNSNNNVAYKKSIENGDNCLKQSYVSDYNKFYTDMFGEVYIKQKERK